MAERVKVELESNDRGRRTEDVTAVTCASHLGIPGRLGGDGVYQLCVAIARFCGCAEANTAPHETAG